MPRTQIAPAAPPGDAATADLVRLRDVCIVHGRGDRATVAVEGVDLAIGRREFLCVIGPSGCGKSTMLKAIAGLLPAGTVQGSITIEGRSPEDARRANSFAYVFQEPVLAPWRTALENVRLPLEVARGRSPEQRRSPEELLELVGLAGAADKLPGQLSGGMRQRVSIARALTLHPSVLLMDEPFGALDEITRDHMHTELLSIWAATDASVVMVTHSLTEAVFMADRVLVMSPRPGRITAELAVEFERPRTHQLKSDLAFHQKVDELRAALEDA
ncbi:ABC transporter ATP-binding protein [Klenkia brasiliensis]|uniref:NitT/TauT family transport system ATP-binding protein n=1 Tax=Klenkia brasiliensis TaxID=333142 RepID=A0A1G7SUV8_9ACTN|nr:ABC transporter ATP-binding protein [Klenkia brasiliensis]SDG26857.1 NitT/TauT family transport system ATP-binding protein [Klenkia brasiliensis]